MYDQHETQLLDLLAERAGIAAEYYDIHGIRHVASAETKQGILAAMGFTVDSGEALARELTRIDETPWSRPCDPVTVIQQGAANAHWTFRLPFEGADEQKLRITWELRDETGAVIHQDEIGPGLVPQDVKYIAGNRYVQFAIPVPAWLVPGYYDVVTSAKGGRTPADGCLRLIVAPSHCYVPDALLQGGKVWGLAVQLYSLRSATNWGAGDFTDLRDLVDWAGKDLGASLVGVNPLHALKNSHPHHLSPYAPNSRLYLNELYIDLDRLPEFHSSPDARQARGSQEFQNALEAARKSDRVDYDAVSRAKRTMLDWAYRQFLRHNYSGNEPTLQPRTARGWLLERFIREEGEALEWYAIFQVLEEERRLVDPRATVWQEWPKQYQAPTSPAVREFGRRHKKRVRFFQYIQWIAAEQLREVGARALSARMAVGLYRDLALGSDRSGAESWIFQEALALTADCGAPPDAFAPQGQNWGFPPFNPLRMRDLAYRPYIQLLRKNLGQGGALRIDHVMALFRLFWVPRGMPASAGTYVYYPSSDLLSILALESMRANTLIIGEDLGTVPDSVREELSRRRVLSYRVFYFERTPEGAMKAPATYPEQSLAVVTTHDLPTLSGYWTGEDIHLRAGLGIYTTEEAKKHALDERQRDKRKILSALKLEGLLPDGASEEPADMPSMTSGLCEAIHAYLAKSSSSVVLANVDDLIGEVMQMNLPGTVDSYPNWSRKLSLTLDELRRDKRIREMAGLMRTLRPSVPTAAA
ncbi:4-alpha-glucanotransferase [Nitrospira sp. Nam80]